MIKSKKVVVLGGGSFGTVLANLAASNGYDVSLWVRDAEQALRINSEGANTDYHPELRLSEKIEASDDLKKVIESASVILIATPSSIFENIVQRIVYYYNHLSVVCRMCWTCHSWDTGGSRCRR